MYMACMHVYMGLLMYSVHLTLGVHAQRYLVCECVVCGVCVCSHSSTVIARLYAENEVQKTGFSWFLACGF